MNYLEYYGLQQEPFTNAPAIKFFYNSAQHSTALLRVMHAIEGMRGLALVLGQAGKGKTTLARRILEQLSPEMYQSALLVVVHAAVEPEWFLKKIARQIGIEEIGEDKVELLAKVSERLFQIHREGRKTVVLIDEAQMLRSREILEEMRGLLNIEAAESKLITFILFGLPDLDEVLEIDPPLKQRVATRVRLENLSREGAAHYVRHRMRLAGSNQPTFAEGALDQIFLYTRGNPRLINTICDNALLEGFLLGREVVDRSLVDAVAQDLGLVGADSLVAEGSDTMAAELDVPAPAAAVAASAGAELDAAVAEWDEDDGADSLDLLDELTADEAEESVDAAPADGSVDLESLVDDEDAVLDDLLSGVGDEPADGEVDLAALLGDDEPEGADVDALLAEFEAEAAGAADAADSPVDEIDNLLAGLDEEPVVGADAGDTGDLDVDDLLAGLDEEAPAIEIADEAADDDLDALLGDLGPQSAESDDASDIDAMLDDLGPADPTPADGDVDLDALLGELPSDESELDVSGLDGADDDALSDLLSGLEDDGDKSETPADEQSEIDDLLDQLGDLENG